MDAVNSTTNQNVFSSTGATSSTTTDIGMNSLGRDAFLQLLVTQMQYQDPLKPMDNEQMIAQLAQFSALEQMQGVNTKMDSLLQGNSAGMAASFLGHTVTATDADGNMISGKVDAVFYDSNTPTLRINGKQIDITSITSVQ